MADGRSGDATYRWGTMCRHHIQGICAIVWRGRWRREHRRGPPPVGLGSASAQRFAGRSGCEGHAQARAMGAITARVWSSTVRRYYSWSPNSRT
jgi:hypothetical protein